MKNIAIIGGGILGLAIGYRLSTNKKNYRVTVIEKETELGEHQSGRNSGVLHCGLNYKPKSLKAQLAVQGIRDMIEFCKENDVAYDQCGKIVVATDEEEEATLDDVAERGRKNGLKGLRFLNSKEISDREPHIKGTKALLVPEEGIVDYKGVMYKLAERIQEYGGKVLLGSKASNLKSKGDKQVVVIGENEQEFDFIINCSGLHSDRVFSKFTECKRPLRIVPFRGEYLSFKEEYHGMVNHLVYPVPNSKFPFLGIHFTRMITGEREVGPNAVFAFRREGYRNLDFSLMDTIDSLFYKGFYRFIKNNFNFLVGEFRSSLLKRSFIKKARKMMPGIKSSMLVSGGAGVRAQAMSPEGDLIMDFRIEKINNQIHVLNAPSPAATASLAIASYIIKNYIK